MRRSLLLLFLTGCTAAAAQEPTPSACEDCESRSESCAMPPDDPTPPGARSVVGDPLEVCSTAPVTGFFRDGRCHTGPTDRGVHVVCARVTDAFLQYSRSQGNDLMRARPRSGFPGLRAGDQWCLCAGRWAEAERAGVAPPVVLEATHEAALRTIRPATLRRHGVRGGPG